VLDSHTNTINKHYIKQGWVESELKPEPQAQWRKRS